MSAMVDGAAWVRAATETGQAIMASLTRAGADPRPYGHLVSYVTSTFRDVVKAVAGALPKKVAEDAWRIGTVGKSRWSYQRDAEQYIFNAHAGFTYITVEAAPTVCIWGWPDRSDLCLQAFVDTVAVGTADPVTVILPDVPALRDFARRYVRGERMDKIERALIEEYLYRGPGNMVNKRGYRTLCRVRATAHRPRGRNRGRRHCPHERARVPRRPPHASAIRLGRPRRRSAARGRHDDSGCCATLLRAGVRSLGHGALVHARTPNTRTLARSSARTAPACSTR